jgi:RNA polymerase sigma-70 factor (ECF subfamily)
VKDVDDRELVEQVLSGEVDAYGDLVARYQQRLYWVAFRLLGNREDARDITQEAFLRAYHRLAGFDRSRKFYTWIYRILVNLGIDQMRKQGRRGSMSLLTDIEGGADAPDARALSEELRGRVWETLDRLPPRYRALLILRDVEGLTGKDISDRTGVGHATVRWRIHRARKLFKTEWESRARREDP